MVEIVTGVANFRADEAWGGKQLGTLGNAETMILWADRPFHWHQNKADELFVVLHGRVEMHYRDAASEQRQWLETGDMILVRQGEEHFGAPDGEARMLIVAAPER